MDIKSIYENAISFHNLFENYIVSEDDDSKSQEVRNLMANPDNWVVNDYNGFVDSLNKSTRSGFLTHYTPEKLKELGATTYQLNGYNIGYALIPTKEGEVDIVSVHNNEPDIHNVGDVMLKNAVKNGGTQLDHFDGKLSDFYSRNGFVEHQRLKWNDEYAPEDWDYEKYGRPDVIVRKNYQSQVNEWVNKQKTITEMIEKFYQK